MYLQDSDVLTYKTVLQKHTHKTVLQKHTHKTVLQKRTYTVVLTRLQWGTRRMRLSVWSYRCGRLF